ncbi:MAG: AAA family ATPase [Cyanobacteria bacterium REEB67]|nr:AAA family ATPase [Cyanobacteria bacterium REEB67]
MTTSRKITRKSTDKGTATVARKPIVLDVYSATRSEDDMTSWLNTRMIGQGEAVTAAVRMKTMALSKLKSGDKAAGLYYLIGEPGVGKTELVKLLAEYLHGSRKAYVKIDGASLSDKSDASRLIGAPPRYVGYEDPKDTEAREAKEAEAAAMDPSNMARKYAKNPRKLLSRKNLVNSRLGSKNNITILFVDEAEKLHGSIDDLFLNAVEDGVMLLGDNEEVDFSDVLVIFAGNPGSNEAVNRKKPIGFREETEEQREEATLDIIMGVLKQRYRPEMLDRFDEFIYFKKLAKEDLRSITSLRINEVIDRYLDTMERGSAFTIDVKTSARDFILEEALKNTGNARRIGRAVRKYFTGPLNRLIDLAAQQDNDFSVLSGDLVVVSHDPQYHEGKLLKFELLEGEGVVAPQDTIKPSKNDTPLGLKFAGFDRKLSHAATQAKDQPKKLVSVTLELENEKELLEEWVAAKKEAASILQMDFVEARTRMHEPWILTLYYEVTDAQAELLKQHYAQGTFAVVGKVAPKANEAAKETKK